MSCYVLIETSPNQYTYYYKKYCSEVFYTGRDLLHMAEIAGAISDDCGTFPWISMICMLASYNTFEALPTRRAERPVDYIYIVSAFKPDGSCFGTPDVYYYRVERDGHGFWPDIVEVVDNFMANRRCGFSRVSLSKSDISYG